MKTRVHYSEEAKCKVIEMKRMVIQIVPLWRCSEFKKLNKIDNEYHFHLI
ncbi:hypothetical protein QUF83_25770 [Bacillus cereus]|nr:hypothetical protein [Bacillus cereus]MDM5239418.1 hypothetical protein [Bacillus cereus]